jgi:glycosyltransferase involved in cell wall biosynthesis
MFPYSVEFSGEPPVRRDSPDTVARIAMLSRHDSRKGVDVLIRALALLKKRGVPFRATLMGPGNLLDFHRGLATQLGLDETDAAIPGFVAEAQEILAQSDIYVLPSIREHSGSMSLLEAMRLGVAPVASDCDGIGEDIRDGKDGLLVPPGDPVALADAIERLIRDPDLRTRLGGAARVTFEERFSLPHLAAALRETYTELGFPPESMASSRAT